MYLTYPSPYKPFRANLAYETLTIWEQCESVRCKVARCYMPTSRGRTASIGRRLYRTGQAAPSS